MRTLRTKLSILSALTLSSLLLLLCGIPSGVASIIGGSEFVYPVMDPKLSSSFGTRNHPIRRVVKHHDGVDLAAPKGSPIRVIADGWVVFAGSYGSYGRLIVVRHNNNATSHYGHCETINVQVGEKVPAGKIIGRVGSTGGATGNHLHFEIRLNGKPLDPSKLIPELTARGEG